MLRWPQHFLGTITPEFHASNSSGRPFLFRQVLAVFFGVAGVLQRFLKRRLLSCLELGDLPAYRLLLNKQRAFLRNLPAEPIEDVSEISVKKGEPGWTSGQKNDHLAANLPAQKAAGHRTWCRDFTLRILRMGMEQLSWTVSCIRTASRMPLSMTVPELMVAMKALPCTSQVVFGL